MARMAGNGLKFMDMTINSWIGRKMLEIAGMTRNYQKLLELAEHGWVWQNGSNG